MYTLQCFYVHMNYSRNHLVQVSDVFSCNATYEINNFKRVIEHLKCLTFITNPVYEPRNDPNNVAAGFTGVLILESRFRVCTVTLCNTENSARRIFKVTYWEKNQFFSIIGLVSIRRLFLPVSYAITCSFIIVRLLFASFVAYVQRNEQIYHSIRVVNRLAVHGVFFASD